ncbi:hypothetical protein D3C75_632390 [compost metagenome]
MILIHEPFAGLIQQHPRKFPVIIAHASRGNSDGRLKIGEFEAVGAVNMPHMPQRGACFLGHQNAVAGVSRIAHGIYRS